MKEMIKRMREEKGGFTLAELLIVVAIVMVLVAIAIPVFNNAMASANASTDEANIRSGWAQAQVYCMTGEDETGTTITNGAIYTLNDSAGLVSPATNAYVTRGNSAAITNLPSYITAWTPGNNVQYTFTASANGVLTAAISYTLAP